MSEGYEPITAELREMMGGVEPRVDEDGVVTAKYVTPEAWGEFVRRCDAIDAVHAGLERENAELRERLAVLDNAYENMHDGGSITDELREWTKGSTLSSWTAEHLTAIADRIDAEHENAMAAAALIAGVPMTDENMAEHGWVRLPLDADGVPINVGDVVEYADGTLPKEVLALVPPTVVMVDTGPRYADMCRHHHATTVEDVLREFANEVYADADNEIRDRDFLCAKYAKRLTLAESE